MAQTQHLGRCSSPRRDGRSESGFLLSQAGAVGSSQAFRQSGSARGTCDLAQSHDQHRFVLTMGLLEQHLNPIRLCKPQGCSKSLGSFKGTSRLSTPREPQNNSVNLAQHLRYQKRIRTQTQTNLYQDNAKGLYRRGVASARLDLLDAAHEDTDNFEGCSTSQFEVVSGLQFMIQGRSLSSVQS